MKCVDGCKITNDAERSIACRLCENVFHIKCIKLTGRIVDYITGDYGLYWLCTCCRKINANMCNVVKKTRLAFLDLSKDLLAVQDKLKKYEQLFNESLLLDDSVSHFKSHKNCGKKNKADSLNTNSSNSLVNDDLIILSPSINSKVSDIVPDQVIEPNVTSALVSKISQLPQSSVKPSSSASLPNPFETISQGNNLKVSKPLPSLKVVQPRRQIFLSRLSLDTSENEIKNFISTKLQKPDIECSVTKFKFTYNRLMSSFKISIPSSEFSAVVDPAFWPSGASVHEFVHNRSEPKKVISLPKISTSKN